MAIIKYANGGTNLYVDWKAGGDATTNQDGPEYVTFQQTVTQGLAALAAAYPAATLRLEGMIWMQGESDVSNSYASEYQTNLTNFIADVRTTIGANLPFVVGRLSANQTSLYNTTDKETLFNLVRSAQDTVATTVPLTALVNTDTYGIKSDLLHFNGSGQQALGNGAAAAVLSIQALNHPPAVNAGANQTVIKTGNPVIWTPATITTAAWYDAADAETITATNTAVTQWDDKSGSNNHLTANGAPKTGTRMINNKNVIDFDGVNSDLSNASLSSAISSQSVSIFSVQQYDVLDVQSMTAWSLHASTATVGMFLHATFGSTASLGLRYPTNTPVQYPESLNIELLSYVKANATSQKGWITGSSQNEVTTSVNTFPAVKLNLGSRNGSNFLNGAIAEFIVVPNEVSTTDREKLEGYLAHKWGLSTSLPETHPYKLIAPGSNYITANLSATVSDPDATQPTKRWSLVSGPSTVIFANPTATNTTAYFTQTGVYVLRLTADDGITQVSDDVTIMVVNHGFEAWTLETFANAFTDTTADGDPDNDHMTNLMEFAFGTDPTLKNSGFLVADGSVNGLPIIDSSDNGGSHHLFFVRRADYETPGSVTYTAQFSSDLVTFYDSAATPTFVGNSTASADYEIVKIPFPATLPNSQLAKFARIKITMITN